MPLQGTLYQSSQPKKVCTSSNSSPNIDFIVKITTFVQKNFAEPKKPPIFAPAKAISHGGTGPVAQLDRATDF
jgi:hypothetical protein